MQFVIGIDSGGTHYRLKAADLEGNVMGSFVGVPANHYYMTHEEMLGRINENIDNLLATFGGSRKDVKALVCGSTGVDSQEDKAKLQSAYEGLPGLCCPMRIMNDAELAHYTVTGGQGILIISGTGSIAYGCNSKGETARCGGWLFTILGDEGSGSWISRRALRHLGRFFDGAVGESPLVGLLRQELDVNSREDLNALAHRMGMQPWFTPALGKTVNDAVLLGDAEAVSILECAAAHIFGIVRDLALELYPTKEQQTFNLGLWGSTLLLSDVLKKRFLHLVLTEFPETNICLTEKESIDGAIELALKLHNETI
nr:BadF/BadG/BcrA/BcrD ATPase family protein [uncultured Sphaerochaeta sp.]